MDGYSNASATTLNKKGNHHVIYQYLEQPFYDILVSHAYDNFSNVVKSGEMIEFVIRQGKVKVDNNHFPIRELPVEETKEGTNAIEEHVLKPVLWGHSYNAYHPSINNKFSQSPYLHPPSQIPGSQVSFFDQTPALEITVPNPA